MTVHVMKAQKLLDLWLEDNEMQDQDFAELVGIDKTQLSHYKCGRRAPSLTYAVKIEDVTKGAVPAKAWTIT